jgi:hypothetical protein
VTRFLLSGVIVAVLVILGGAVFAAFAADNSIPASDAGLTSEPIVIEAPAPAAQASALCTLPVPAGRPAAPSDAALFQPDEKKPPVRPC